MLARIPFFVALALTATHVSAEEIACEGPFAIDSSEARLIETFGAENVVTGIVPGPEGTEMLATTVFPDTKKRLEFVWWDEDALSGPSYIELPAKMTAPGGVRVGQSLAEVEALNGEPFSLSGFGWDYGGGAGFQTGNLSDLPGGCNLGLRFDIAEYPEDIDVTPIMGDVQLTSSDPLLQTLDIRIWSLSVGYPHPDYRDEVSGAD